MITFRWRMREIRRAVVWVDGRYSWWQFHHMNIQQDIPCQWCRLQRYVFDIPLILYTRKRTHRPQTSDNRKEYSRQRIDFNLTVLVYKPLHGLAPPYLRYLPTHYWCEMSATSVNGRPHLLSSSDTVSDGWQVSPQPDRSFGTIF